MARFTTVPIEVDAVELKAPVRLGRQKGRAGDYLVTFRDGRQQIVAAAEFAIAYAAGGNGHATAGVASAPSAPPRTKAGKRNGKAKPPKAERREKLEAAARRRTPDPRREKARRQWEAGEAVTAIGKGAGVSIATIYNWSAAGKWKRPKPGAPDRAAATAAPAAPAPPEPVGTKLSGRVRCTNEACAQMTEYDPCQYCGRELERKKW